MIPTLVDPDATFLARQQRLRDAIAKLADAMAAGDYTPVRVELDAVIRLCQEHYLFSEAARVRRWMTP